MSSGNFIEVESDLAERNAWLQINKEAVEPYLRDGKECTVFTFSREEPADRLTTRIGGIPYWRRDQPWPVCRACSLVRPQAMICVAQLDFRGATGCQTVPGDLLTFHYCVSCNPADARQIEPAEADAFRQRHRLGLPELTDNLAYVPGGGHLTWHTTAPDGLLITATEIPRVPEAVEFGPFYGQPHRAVDYPTPPEAYGGGIAGESYTYLQFTLQGMKIGGYPPPIQDFDVPTDADGRPMRFLGTIGSITGYSVDGKRNMFESRGDLMWGDMGCLYLWMSQQPASAEMAWFWECY